MKYEAVVEAQKLAETQLQVQKTAILRRSDATTPCSPRMKHQWTRDDILLRLSVLSKLADLIVDPMFRSHMKRDLESITEYVQARNS